MILQQDSNVTERSALEPSRFSALDQYAKGLLKPFKGKGEVIRFRDELLNECRRLWQESADFANRYNKTVVQVGLWLTPHQTHGGRGRPVQWRDKQQAKMGRRLWENVMAHHGLSQGMRRQLVEIETERLIFNAKVAAATRQIVRLDRLIKEIDEAERYEQGLP